MVKSTDEVLLELVKRKEANAFEVLYNRYEKKIYNYILRCTGDKALSQELLQETFTKVWFSANLFQPIKGSFNTWILTIALNLTRSEMSKKRYSYHYEDIIGKSSESIPTKEWPDERLEHDDLKNEIAKALGKLKPELREIILLKHFQQLKFREIAIMTETAEGTLKARFQKAMSELKKHLRPIKS